MHSKYKRLSKNVLTNTLTLETPGDFTFENAEKQNIAKEEIMDERV